MFALGTILEIGKGEDINFAKALIVIVAMILQAGVFIACMVVLSGLWRLVFAALQGLDEPRARILIQLLGGVSAAGGGKGSSLSGKAKMAGTGVLGTLLILFSGCLAIYLIGHHTVGIK